MKVVKTKKISSNQIIKEAVSCLEAGGLVIYPTETVYGAGVDATNQQAVNKLLAYKGRREGKPLSIAVSSQQMAEKYVKLSQQARQLYQQFLPGPYTIISPGKNQLPTGVASEFKTLGIRWPDHSLVNNIVNRLGRPITATSANASGKKRPYTVADVVNNLSQKQKNLVDLVIDANQLPPNPPSTVIDTTFSTPITLRKEAAPGSKARDKNKNNKQQKPKLILNSQSAEETKQIAGKLMLKYWDSLKKDGLIFGLSGELGAGKTVFAQGIAEFLMIKQPVTSPTYTYLKEYPFERHQTSGIFYHLDTWKIDNKDQLDTLQITRLPAKKTAIAIEWWSQIKTLVDFDQAQLIEVELEVKTKTKRKLIIYEPNK